MAIRVLMIDDDPVHLELSEQFLKRQSSEYEIVPAETPEEAMNLLLEDSFDAAVCDIDLGENQPTGLDILEQVRVNERDIPVIIFTGKSREEIAIQALNLGADYYIRKSSSKIEGLYAELSYYILTSVKKRRTEKALVESERRLRESEAKLAEAQRIAHLGHWTWDIVNNNITWSDEIYRIFGLAPQEFEATYEAFLNSVHEDDREYVRKSVDKALNENWKYSIDHRIVLPDRNIRFVHEEGEVTYDEDGKALQMMGTVQDITERVQREMDLRNQEAWWQGVFNHAPGAVAIFDSEGLLIDINNAGLDLLGMKSRQDVLGLDLFGESRLPDDVLESVRKGEVYRFDYKWDFKYVAERAILKTSRTDIIYMDVTLSSLQDESGKSKGYVMHVSDMTERKLTETALRANEEMFRTIFEESPICVELFDSDGLLLSANQATLDLFGVDSLEDLVGFDLFKDPNTPDYVKDSLRNGEIAMTEARFDFSKVKVKDLYKTKKSGIMHLDCVYSPIKYGKEEDLQGFIVHVQNVTDRALAEQALVESRESYKGLYNNALVGLFRVRISDGMILECNDQFALSFGFEKEGAMIDGSTFIRDILAKPNEWENLKDNVREQQRFVTELHVNAKDGERRWMRVSLNLWAEKGYIEGVMTDITEQKKALEMLKKQKEELSDFAHSISHDLKNIFHNMLGFIELIEEEQNFGLLTKLRSLINETGEMVDHSVALADAGLIIEETSDIDLSPLVREVADSIIPERVEYSQDDLPVVSADQRKVAQIFRNLFDNAIQHGQPKKIEVSAKKTDGAFLVRVSNDGKIIPELQRTKIFLRGFTTSKNGQGYGLAIVRRLVEAHGWSIKLLSERETTFEIEIPAPR